MPGERLDWAVWESLWMSFCLFEWFLQDDGASGEGPPKSVRRGRPPGSRNKVSRATAGIHPHVLMVNSGEVSQGGGYSLARAEMQMVL